MKAINGANARAVPKRARSVYIISRADWLTALWCAAAALALAGGARWWTSVSYAACSAAGIWAVGSVGRYSRRWRFAGRWMSIGAILASVASIAAASAFARTVGGWRYGAACAAALIAACLPIELTLSAAKRTIALTAKLKRSGVTLLKERALRVLSRIDMIAIDPADTLVQGTREASAAAAPADIVSFEKLARAPSFIMLMMSCALCSSMPSYGISNSDDPDADALRAFARSYGFDADKLAARFPAVSDTPEWLRAPGTRSERRGQGARFALHRERGGLRLFAQSTPEMLLPLCDSIFDARPRVMTPFDTKRIGDTLNRMRASSSMVYAFAAAEVSEDTESMPKLAFVGLIALTNVVNSDTLDIIDTLRVQRIQPALVSSWSEPLLAGLIGRIESNRVLASALPEDKARAVADLRRQGSSVAAVGACESDAMMMRAANASIWLSGTLKPPVKISPDAVVSSFDQLPMLFEETSREMARRVEPFRRQVWVYHAILLAAAIALCAFEPRFAVEFAWAIPLVHIAAGWLGGGDGGL